MQASDGSPNCPSTRKSCGAKESGLPLSWAATQNNLGNVRRRLHKCNRSRPDTLASASSSRAVPLSFPVLCRRPVERPALARPFLQRLAMSRKRLRQPRRPALAASQLHEHIAEIVLRRCPVERNALAHPFLQRLAIGSKRLLQPRCTALALPEPQDGTTVCLLRRPYCGPHQRAEGEWHSLC